MTKFCEDCKYIWIDPKAESLRFAKCSHPKASPYALVGRKNEPDAYCSSERRFGRFFGCGPKGNRWEPKT